MSATLQGAIELFHAGRFAEAIAAAHFLLEDEGERADALNIAAISVQRLGNVGAAEQYLRRAIAVQPDFAPALSNLGLLLEKEGRRAEAISAYRKALDSDPDCAEAATNLGLILQNEGNLTAAEAVYRQVLAGNPDFPEALFNLSNLLIDSHRLAEAEPLVRHALQLRPDHAGVQFNRGRICGETGRAGEAELAYQAALACDPGFVGAANNLGLLLQRKGRPEEACEAYRRALTIDPLYARAWNNLGNLLSEQRQRVEARDAYARAVQLDPAYHHAIGKLSLSSRQLCDWSSFDAIEERIRSIVAGGEPDGLAPFEMLIVGNLSGADHKAIAKAYAWEVHGPALSLPPLVQGIDPARAGSANGSARPDGAAGGATQSPTGGATLSPTGATLSPTGGATLSPTGVTSSPGRERRLRIGYVSSDYSEHATTHLFAGVLAKHDRKRVEVFCYSTGKPILDAGRQRIIDGCEHFRDFFTVSDDEATAIIMADGIDILVDLKGYTESDRLGIQARRPAPVVVTWLGYPGTLGEPRLADYVIGDAIVTPPEQAGDFSETLALMPHCYQPNDNRRPVGAAVTRAEVGLPDKALVLCNFNASYKISPQVFELWMEVLRRVPDSVLWLLLTAPEAAANLREEAKRLGIDGKRLIFAPPLAVADHVARLKLADLAIDTLPYCSHTTGSDALWAGVPLATRTGSIFASKVAASLLTNIGLPELITDNDADYLALLLDLAQNRKRLRSIRKRLATNRSSSPLFDTTGFAIDLVDLYERIWQQELRGTRAILLPQRKARNR